VGAAFGAKAVGSSRGNAGDEIEMYQLFFNDDQDPKAVPFKNEAARDAKEYKLIATFRKLNQQDHELTLAMVWKMAKAA